MESGDERLGQRGVAQELFNALAHLGGGLVGKRDGENRVRGYALVLNEPGDAVRDDAGFARTGAGQNKYGPFNGFDGSALFGIEIGEERMQSNVPDRIGPVTILPLRRSLQCT